MKIFEKRKRLKILAKWLLKLRQAARPEGLDDWERVRGVRRVWGLVQGGR